MYLVSYNWIRITCTYLGLVHLFTLKVSGIIDFQNILHFQKSLTVHIVNNKQQARL